MSARDDKTEIISSMTLEQQIFNSRLLSIGGRSANGKPRLRVVSAATETKFACGGYKIKYPQSSKTDERWLWGLRDIEAGITYAKTQEQVEQCDDPNMLPVRKFLGRTVTWIGYPNWVIEYYRSPLEMKDGPVNWETNRYDYWYNPETKRREFTDMNGEWPADGRYDLLLVVKVEDGTRWGQYRELGEDVLNEVRQAIQKHEAFKKVNTDEELIKQMVDKCEAREDKRVAELADAIEQEIGAEWRRAIKDNLLLSQFNPPPTNKITNHGRAR